MLSKLIFSMQLSTLNLDFNVFGNRAAVEKSTAKIDGWEIQMQKRLLIEDLTSSVVAAARQVDSNTGKFIISYFIGESLYSLLKKKNWVSLIQYYIRPNY